MKKISLFLILFFYCINCFATEYSEFSAKQYGKFCEHVPHITLKKEYLEIYGQEIGNEFIPYIAFGYGDLKIKKCKKQRVTYICLLDCKLKPIWSHIYFYK